jgi:hypothetical protein
MLPKGVYVRGEVSPAQNACDNSMKEQEDPHERITGNHLTAAVRLFTSLASTLAHDQLQQLVSQPGDQHTTAAFQNRRLFGRWLTMRRLCCGVTAETIADQTGVDASLLRLLELGLATNMGSEVEERWARLALMLADAHHDADLVMAVLCGAIGRNMTIDDRMLDRVVNDLRLEL